MAVKLYFSLFFLIFLAGCASCVTDADCSKYSGEYCKGSVTTTISATCNQGTCEKTQTTKPCGVEQICQGKDVYTRSGTCGTDAQCEYTLDLATECGVSCSDGECSQCGNGRVQGNEQCDSGYVAGQFNDITLNSALSRAGCAIDCKRLLCTDSSTNLSIKGTVTMKYANGSTFMTFEDSCRNGTLHENYCQSSNAQNSRRINCSERLGEGYTCVDGRCLGAVCGNGVKESGEVCDDGNTANDDGCSASCVLEPVYVCAAIENVSLPGEWAYKVLKEGAVNNTLNGTATDNIPINTTRFNNDTTYHLHVRPANGSTWNVVKHLRKEFAYCDTIPPNASIIANGTTLKLMCADNAGCSTYMLAVAASDCNTSNATIHQFSNATGPVYAPQIVVAENMTFCWNVSDYALPKNNWVTGSYKNGTLLS